MADQNKVPKWFSDMWYVYVAGSFGALLVDGQGSLLLHKLVGSLLFKYSNFQQIYKKTQPIL